MKNTIVESKSLNKYQANFVGITKTVYANNLEQAFQEADVFAIRNGLVRNTLTDLDEVVDNPPYFGIYNQ